MNVTTILMLVAGLSAFLLIGPRLARSTEKRETLYGGAASLWLNRLACMTFVSLPITVLTGLISGIVTQQHGPLLQVALALLATTFILLIVWAAIEMPAQAKAPKVQRTALNSWTQEDARSSGL